MLTAEAEGTSMLKLKNGDDNGVVVDSSLLEDIVAGIEAGTMNIDSPKVGTSDDDDDYDVRHCHLAGPSFWG